MRSKIAAGCLMILFFAAGCTRTSPCGAFTFTGSPHNNRGVNATVNFTFNPAACGARCSCNAICYIQIVRIIDQDTGEFLAPNSEQALRIVNGEANLTQNGWAVDRLAGMVWGYYGRNNDGSFSGTLTPGSNGTAATLRDEPSNWPDNSWFDAVSVTVCIDQQAPCNNQLLGYYYWLFVVNQGTATAPLNAVAVTWMQDAVDRAVANWNFWAPPPSIPFLNLPSKNTFPAMSRL